MSYFTDENDRKWWEDDFEIEPADDHTWRRFLLIAALILIGAGIYEHFYPRLHDGRKQIVYGYGVPAGPCWYPNLYVNVKVGDVYVCPVAQREWIKVRGGQ